MIIKILSRHINRCVPYQLIKYINEGRESFDDEDHFILSYNTTGKTAKGVAADFYKNNEHVNRRKGKQVGLYHAILSFHPRERLLLNDAKLHAFGRKFGELIKAEDGIAFGRPHWERDNVHIHFALSASYVGSGKSRRMSKAQLKELQVTLNRYQQEQYPELKHSLLYLPEFKKSRQIIAGIPAPLPFKESDGSIQVKKRGKTSHLDSIRQDLGSLAKKHLTKDRFLKALENHSDLEVYFYRGKATGVVSKTGKKYRFKRLGIDLDHLKVFVRSLDIERVKAQQLLKESPNLNRSL